ncbi:MAG: peptide-methionine (R)-S-oxide reductase MsrB [Salinispira sp.]
MSEPKNQKDWKKILDPQVYKVTRLGGTEPAFSGKHYREKRRGHYTCSNCDAPLFHSSAKYDSGSGWPSFFQPVKHENVRELEDFSQGMLRTEARCASCDAHLGHTFPDGPEPTGIRYCINSLSLNFEEE